MEVEVVYIRVRCLIDGDTALIQRGNDGLKYPLGRSYPSQRAAPFRKRSLSSPTSCLLDWSTHAAPITLAASIQVRYKPRSRRLQRSLSFQVPVSHDSLSAAHAFLGSIPLKQSLEYVPQSWRLATVITYFVISWEASIWCDPIKGAWIRR